MHKYFRLIKQDDELKEIINEQDVEMDQMKNEFNQEMINIAYKLESMSDFYKEMMLTINQVIKIKRNTNTLNNYIIKFSRMTLKESNKS